MNKFLLIGAAGLAVAACSLLNASAQTRTLRIVTYNIQADVSGLTPPLPGLIAPPGDTNNFQAGGVLEGIGEEIVNGNAQPIDVLALQETTSNSITVTPIVNALNTFYAVPGMYSNSIYPATQSGGKTNNGFGNGPNAMVYNTRTVQLLASAPVDPPGGTNNLGGISSGKSGMYREVMRYQFAPAGVATNATNIFYVYVSHYKSNAGSFANDTNSRAGEAAIVRGNMMTNLPAAARILHVGDFNTGDASEPMYGILTAPGTNQLIDPLNPSRSLTTNFDGSTTPANMTESAMSLQYRDDYQMMTTNIYYGSGNGLKLISGTYHVFGNNGTTPYLGTVNSGSNTSLTNRLATNGPIFITTAQLYKDLTNTSDHLPVVADYTIPVPAPLFTGVSLATGTNLVVTVANSATGGVYLVLMSTNLSLPLTNWTVLATNVADGNSFIFTATNAVNPAVPKRFYLLQQR